MVLQLVDQLADRLIQLITVRKRNRRELLEESIAPVFAAFEAVHAAYLESFAKYREALRTTSEPLTSAHPLVDTIRSDNLFSEHERAKILSLGSVVVDSRVEKFTDLVRGYLVDVRIAAEPIGGYRSKRFANPQHWRRTLLAELEAIFDGHWQPILDPDSSAPPLWGAELDRALSHVAREGGIADDDPARLEKLKKLYAVRALDAVVEDMQETYGSICEEYAGLKQVLSK